MFKNRNEAGKKLAEKIRQEANLDWQNSLIVSLPKGGVVIGAVLSALLKIPHQVLIVKKISLPGNPELAIGAISSSKKSLLLNQELIRQLGGRQEEVDEAVANAQGKIQEIKSKLNLKELGSLKNKQIIIADDGAATGSTIRSAVKEVGELGAQKIIIALPVAPQETVEELKQEVDEVVVVEQPKLFFAVSEFYQDFPQLTWDEVKNLLKLKSEREFTRQSFSEGGPVGKRYTMPVARVSSGFDSQQVH